MEFFGFVSFVWCWLWSLELYEWLLWRRRLAGVAERKLARAAESFVEVAGMPLMTPAWEIPLEKLETLWRLKEGK